MARLHRIWLKDAKQTSVRVSIWSPLRPASLHHLPNGWIVLDVLSRVYPTPDELVELCTTTQAREGITTYEQTTSGDAVGWRFGADWEGATETSGGDAIALLPVDRWSSLGKADVVFPDWVYRIGLALVAVGWVLGGAPFSTPLIWLGYFLEFSALCAILRHRTIVEQIGGSLVGLAVLAIARSVSTGFWT